MHTQRKVQVRTQLEDAICKPRRDTLILGVLPPELGENKCLLFRPPILLWQPHQTNIIVNIGIILQRMSPAQGGMMGLSLGVSSRAELRDGMWTRPWKSTDEPHRDSSVSCGHIGLYSVWTQVRGLLRLMPWEPGSPRDWWEVVSGGHSYLSGATSGPAAKKEGCTTEGAPPSGDLYSAPQSCLKDIPGFRGNVPGFRRNGTAGELPQRWGSICMSWAPIRTDTGRTQPLWPCQFLPAECSQPGGRWF